MSYSSTTTTYAYDPCFFEYPQSEDSISNKFTSKFCFGRPLWELDKCEKKHGKIDICHAVIFPTILFNGTFCAYNSCIFLSINNHSYPLGSFLHQNLDLGHWSTLKVIVKNNFDFFLNFKKDFP